MHAIDLTDASLESDVLKRVVVESLVGVQPKAEIRQRLDALLA